MMPFRKKYGTRSVSGETWHCRVFKLRSFPLTGLVVIVLAASHIAAQTRSTPQWPARPAPQRSPSQSKDPLQEAEDLLQKQQYAEAKEKLQAVTSGQARNPQAWFDLGYAQS